MITMTDLFCGAGGSSTGALAVPGVSVRMAANHWPLAIETHNTNHPTTDHACADISQVDPRMFPRTDILWASPECTNHSQARGKKREGNTPDLFGEVLPDAAAERSRATMWDVPRFAEYHRYSAVIIENVVDAYHWQPFPAWLMAMDSLGYEHDLVFLNSMHAQFGGLPAPQSRDRMYVVFWRKGNRRPNLEKHTRPPALCPSCGPVKAMQAWKRTDRPKWGRYRAQYVWRCPNVACRNQILEPAWLPAAAAIDWTLPGQRIGDRVKPLAPKTMARIEAGLKKYADPFLTVHRYEYRTASLTDVAPTITASGNTLGLLVPVESRDGKEARPTGEPMRTMTTRNETAFVVPLRAHNTPKGVQEPFDTFAANGNHHALVVRNNSSKGDGGEMVTPVTEVLRTLTTTGHQSLLVPYRSNSTAHLASDPLPTLSTVDPAAIASMETRIDDCMFRMLEPREIAAGMAFPATYIIKGNRREQVRQAGNAVTPPAARDLIAAVAESLGAA
jgi:DNA (cytosine-5)-methyltransferase 1